MKNNKAVAGKRLKMVIAILSVLAIMLAIGFAWYSYYKKHTDSEKMEIMTPYTLYLLNSGATDTLELNVGGIHPGETKQIVVCVSSHDVGAEDTQTSKEGIFPYTLELIHTENVGLTYNLYPLTRLAFEASGEDIISSDYTVAENGSAVVKKAYFQKGDLLSGDTTKSIEYQKEMYGESNVASVVNKGTYCVYSKNEFQLSLSDPDKRYNYFLVEIVWSAETTGNSKETDLVYLVAKAGVPKPVEKE